MKKLALITALLATGTFSLSAAARPTYPYYTAQALDMTCLPQCTLCHTSNPGNGDNVTQPFSDNLVYADGDTKRMPATNDELLEALANYPPNVDSDLDGVANLKELEADPPTDPNDPEKAAEICQPPTQYGCGAASWTGAEPPTNAWPELLGLGVLLGALSLRRRPSHG